MNRRANSGGLPSSLGPDYDPIALEQIFREVMRRVEKLEQALGIDLVTGTLTAGKVTITKLDADVILDLSLTGTLDQSWLIKVADNGQLQIVDNSDPDDQKIVVVIDRKITEQMVATSKEDPDDPGSANILELLKDPDGKFGVFDAPPVERPAAYTLNGGTSRTIPVYVEDDQSAAYSGIDNAQAGTPYATVDDLNTLRAAYETMRPIVLALAEVLNQVITDHKDYGYFEVS